MSAGDGGGPPRISADPDRCLGAGQCARSAPDVFDQDDDGTVVVLRPDPPTETHDQIREAIYLCPSSAISFDAAE
ncbi:ferredoxin [Actinomadura spongiicola]|uniref:Ferredoxin n=1 Tax=Actinomadura spongiicola TaxID=2303421 RepID=A0A372G6X5_9ACTN|nr:ferredoxin [Actinomadura spongiicola]RFS81057.1 ferredoxin [Actinomadura spongiicola]